MKTNIIRIDHLVETLVKKILINMPSQYAGKNSGVSKVVFALLEELVKSKEFIYILRSPWAMDDLPEELKRSGLSIIKVNRPKILIFNVLIQSIVVPVLCKVKGIDFLLNADPYGSPFGGRSNATIVHDLYFKTIKDRTSFRASLTSTLIFALLMVRSKRFVTVSEATKNNLERYFPSSRGRVEVIHSASILKIAKSATLTQKNYESPGYLLLVGNYTYNKNFKVVFEALSRNRELFRNLLVVHVGEDSANILSATHRALDSTFLFEQKSNVREAELIHLYSNARFLCVPSLDEGFCLPILEANICGCPVLCSQTSSMPEIAGDSALTFKPNDVEDLATKLEIIYTDGELRRQLVARGYENVSRFSWQAAARRYEELFRSV